MSILLVYVQVNEGDWSRALLRTGKSIPWANIKYPRGVVLSWTDGLPVRRLMVCLSLDWWYACPSTDGLPVRRLMVCLSVDWWFACPSTDGLPVHRLMVCLSLDWWFACPSTDGLPVRRLMVCLSLDWWFACPSTDGLPVPRLMVCLSLDWWYACPSTDGMPVRRLMVCLSIERILFEFMQTHKLTQLNIPFLCWWREWCQDNIHVVAWITSLLATTPFVLGFKLFSLKVLFIFIAFVCCCSIAWSYSSCFLVLGSSNSISISLLRISYTQYAIYKILITVWSRSFLDQN
jgi:hypothetical protein